MSAFEKSSLRQTAGQELIERFLMPSFNELKREHQRPLGVSQHTGQLEVGRLRTSQRVVVADVRHVASQQLLMNLVVRKPAPVRSRPMPPIPLCALKCCW